MDRDEALKLLCGGPDGVAEWNRWRENHSDDELPDLGEADLSKIHLRRANLSCVDLTRANFQGSNLRHADFSGAVLYFADFTGSALSYAKLRSARLTYANFNSASLTGTDFAYALFGATVLANIDLSRSNALCDASFAGPCRVGLDTLSKSKGQIPEDFLTGCGLQPWEILFARLYNPALTPAQINEVQSAIYEARAKGLFIGSVLISYSHDDSLFVDKLRARLQEEGASTWVDRHDAVAGPLKEQIDRAIRLNDVVLLVLSESSMNSDWVEYELDMTRRKEKEESRDILCPVALDDAWKAKLTDVLWRQVKKKNVLNFSGWQTDAFEPQFKKLLDGMKIYYAPPPEPNAPD